MCSFPWPELAHGCLDSNGTFRFLPIDLTHTKHIAVSLESRRIGRKHDVEEHTLAEVKLYCCDALVPSPFVLCIDVVAYMQLSRYVADVNIT